MDVNADEQINSAVAAMLAVVAFDLARLGRDGLAHLADQLDRALVEIGLIQRQPSVARSIELLVTPEGIPILK